MPTSNFLIPEIARGLAYRKGPYYAAEGDFASAGAVYLDVVDRLAKSFAQVEVGSFGHERAVTGMSVPVGPDGTLLAAGEIVRFDGPWDRPDDLRKLNGVLRYSQGTYANGFALTAMAYSGDWYSTDQIPQRAVDQGLIGRFGNLDRDRRRLRPPLLSFGALARDDRGGRHARQRLRHQERPRPLQQLHLLPQ